MYNTLMLPMFDYCNVVVGNGNSGILTGYRGYRTGGMHYTRMEQLFT